MMRGWQFYLGCCVLGVSPLLSLREVVVGFCLIGIADALGRIQHWEDDASADEDEDRWNW